MGFGLQLGAGFITVVATGATYAAFLAAFLSGAGVAGAAIGLVFGLTRGLNILLGAPIRRSEQLLRFGARLHNADRPARVGVALVQVIAVAVVVTSALV